jgi:hypothetical protein
MDPIVVLSGGLLGFGLSEGARLLRLRRSGSRRAQPMRISAQTGQRSIGYVQGLADPLHCGTCQEESYHGVFLEDGSFHCGKH